MYSAPPGSGRAVADPLAWSGHDRLAGGDVEGAAFELHPHRAAKDDGDLFEVGPLAGLEPAFGRLHPRDAHVVVPAVHAAGKFFDALGLVPRRLNHGRGVNQRWHGVTCYVLRATG